MPDVLGAPADHGPEWPPAPPVDGEYRQAILDAAREHPSGALPDDTTRRILDLAAAMEIDKADVEHDLDIARQVLNGEPVAAAFIRQAKPAFSAAAKAAKEFRPVAVSTAEKMLRIERELERASAALRLAELDMHNLIRLSRNARRIFPRDFQPQTI
jgi:hypothetical protein